MWAVWVRHKLLHRDRQRQRVKTRARLTPLLRVLCVEGVMEEVMEGVMERGREGGMQRCRDAEMQRGRGAEGQRGRDIERETER